MRAGIVFASRVTRTVVAAPHPVASAPLQDVRVSVLIVHHQRDGCSASPYAAMPELVAAFKSAKKVELISEEGGTGGGACTRGAHTLLGMEAAVIKDIADWIKRYQAGAAQ